MTNEEILRTTKKLLLKIKKKKTTEIFGIENKKKKSWRIEPKENTSKTI